MKPKLLLAIALSIPLLAQGAGPGSSKHKIYRVVMVEPDTALNSYPAGYLFFSPLSNRGGLGVWESAQPSELPNVPPFPIEGPDDSFTWTDGIRTNFQGLQSAGGTTYINWINRWAWAAGYATNGHTDPLVGGLEVNAVIWAPDGRIFDLGTMGGYQSRAVWINDFGQVSGWVENTTSDPYSMGAGAQTQGFIWQNGIMRLLGTLGGPDSYGEFINDLGQVSGHSYTSDIPNSVTGVPPFDPFIWEAGKMTDINPGNFGGAEGGTNFLNDRGQAVGFGTTPGETGAHPFLWQNGKLTDLFTIGNLGGDVGSAYYVNEEGDVIGGASLPTQVFEFQSVMWRGSEFTDIGVLPGDTCSQPYFINSRDQVVGASAADCNFTSIRAYIWEKGEIVDLNTLIPANAGIHLEYANWINEHGEIAAEGVLSSNGNAAAVLLVPDCDCGDRCEAQIQSAEKTAPPPAAANGPSKESAMRRFLRPGSMAVH